MSKRVARMKDKAVGLSEAYKAPAGEIVGREQEMRKILAAWMGSSSGLPLSPLLLGEPGLGKNRIVYECARVCGKELYIYQGHEDVTAEDLICAVRFSDDPDRKMDYILSAVSTAMRRGAVCFIDEIGKIRPRALAPLASLLDERRYIDSTLLGERIHAHPGFRFIAATNKADFGEDLLPDFIRSRMKPVITIGYPDRREIEEVIRSRFRALQGDGRPLLDRFWALWREESGDRPPTPRDSIHIFALAINYADLERTSERGSCDTERCAVPVAVSRRHLEEAFSAFHDHAGGAAHA